MEEPPFYPPRRPTPVLTVRRRGPAAVAVQVGRDATDATAASLVVVIDVGKKLSDSAKNCEKGERSELLPLFLPHLGRQWRATELFCASVDGNGVCG